MKKKKVLFRISSMDFGDAQKVLIDVLNSLDQNKFEVALLLDYAGGALEKEIPIQVLLYPITNGIGRFSKYEFIRFFHRVRCRLHLEFYKVFPFLLERKLSFIPDVEIAFTHLGLPALLRSPFTKSKKINWFHSDISFFDVESRNRVLELMERCDITVFVSDTTKKRVEEYFKESISNGVLIYNLLNDQKIKELAQKFVDTEEFFKSQDCKTFVSVGRLVYQKGYDILLEAHKDLIREGIYHRIVIIGNGPDYCYLKEQISFLGLEETFILLGEKENPFPYMVAANFYIQSSRYESYPLTVKEALILNKPIISTDSCGVREIIEHGETGYIVECSKIGLKKGMKMFLVESEPVNKIKQKQKQRETDFNLHNQQTHQQLECLLLENKEKYFSI